MVNLVRCWILPVIFCSLYAFSSQTYIGTDFSPDYVNPEERTNDELSPYVNKILLQALMNAYYNSIPPEPVQVPAPPVNEEPTAIESVETNEVLPSKRSRYYRKYPGKRQNRRLNDLYECIPNTKETVRLLFAIHQARQGDADHVVFCNRLRNPKTLIPNPRYIGKRAD